MYKLFLIPVAIYSSYVVFNQLKIRHERQLFIEPKKLRYYKKGRSITALGDVVTFEEGKIGEHEYDYPVLKASYIHLWKDIPKVDVRVTQNPFWHTPSFWRYPTHYPPRRVIIRKPSTSVKNK